MTTLTQTSTPDWRAQIKRDQDLHPTGDFAFYPHLHDLRHGG